MTRPGQALLAAALLLAGAWGAPAQVRVARDVPRGGSWEAGGGVTWTGGFTGGDRAAELTRNGESSGGFDLFTSSGRIANGVGAGAALAFYLSRAIALEAGFRYSKPRLSFRLTGDAEDASPVTAQETFSRYVFTGSVVWHLNRMRFAGRGIPFVAVGAGYVRELHEGNELIETGTELHALGGVKYWFGGGRRRFGVRGEAGVSVSNGGVDFRDEPRTVPVAAASLLYLF